MTSRWLDLVEGRVALLPGDIVLTKDKRSKLMFMIRECSTSPGEKRRGMKTEVNHVGMTLGFRLDIIEALGKKGMTVNDLLHRYVGERSEVVIARLRIADDLRLMLVTEMLKLEGSGYGHGKILLNALDYIASRLTARDQYLFRRIGRVKRKPICSGSVALAAERIGWRLGRKWDMTWERVQPDDWWDDVFEWKPENYDVIFNTPGFDRQVKARNELLRVLEDDNR